MPTVQCKNCGASVSKTNWAIREYKNLFCSADCHAEYKKKTGGGKYIKCAACEKEAWRQKSKLIISRGLYYCSKKCVSDSEPNKKTKSGRATRTSLVTVNCSNCGAKVQKKKWSLDNFKKSFCSNECHYEYNKKNSGGKNVPCATCGRIIWRNKSTLEKSISGLYYCSRSCANSNNNKIYKSGKNHPNYVNGVHLFVQLGRGSECVDCGEKRKYLLRCHHIDGDRQNNDQSNREIVCCNHHAIRHLKKDSGSGKWIYSSASLTPRHELKNLV